MWTTCSAKHSRLTSPRSSGWRYESLPASGNSGSMSTLRGGWFIPSDACAKPSNSLSWPVAARIPVRQLSPQRTRQVSCGCRRCRLNNGPDQAALVVLSGRGFSSNRAVATETSGLHNPHSIMDIVTPCLQMGVFWRKPPAVKRPESDRKCRRADRHTPAVMSPSDATAVLAEMKRTEALLRDARSVLRRVDALAAKASTSDDPSRALIAEVWTASTWCRSWPIASKSNGAPPSRRRAACADAPRTSARDMSSATTVPARGASQRRGHTTRG